MNSSGLTQNSSGQPEIPGLNPDDEPEGDDVDGGAGDLLLSPSSVIAYMSDPARYYFKKILKRRESSGKAAIEGSTYHAGIEFALNHKKQMGQLPPLPDTLEFVSAFWKAETRKLPIGTRPNDDRLEYVKGFFMSQIYDTIAPIEPKMIEEEVRAPISPGLKLRGFIDLVHTKAPGADPKFDPRTDVLMDFKSKAASPPKDSSTGEYVMGNYDRFQLTLYAWMLSGGNYSVKSKIIYLVKNKVPKIVTTEITISAEEQRRRLKTVVSVANAIRAGHFPPNYGHWLCAPDRCAFFKECHELL